MLTLTHVFNFKCSKTVDGKALTEPAWMNTKVNSFLFDSCICIMLMTAFILVPVGKPCTVYINIPSPLESANSHIN